MGPGWPHFPESTGQSLGTRDGAPGEAQPKEPVPGGWAQGWELGMQAPARAHPPLGHEQLLGTFLLDDISQGIEKRKKKALFSQYKFLQH